RLELVIPTLPDLSHPAIAPDGAGEPLEYNKALWVAGELFGPETGCYKIGADQQISTLTLRFDFPDVAGPRYAGLLADLAAGTGWRVQVHPHANQGALGEAARRALPEGLAPLGAPSVSAATREVVVRCQGTASEAMVAEAQAAFAELTGWRLVIRSG